LIVTNSPLFIEALHYPWKNVAKLSQQRKELIPKLFIFSPPVLCVFLYLFHAMLTLPAILLETSDGSVSRICPAINPKSAADLSASTKA
jgi:hypothetical protein